MVPRIATYDHQTREALLKAAGRILADEGVAQLTMRRLAGEVGATTSAIYALFGSKQEVLQALRRQGFEHLAEHLSRAGPGLPALARAYRQAALQRPDLYQFMFTQPLSEQDSGVVLDALGRVAVWALLHGLTSLELNGCLTDPQSVWDCALETLGRQAPLSTGTIPSTARPSSP